MGVASRAVNGAATAQPRRVAFVGAVVAGHETQFRNVCRVAQRRRLVDPVILSIVPFREDGLLERALPFLPSSTRGTLRSMLATAPLFFDRRLEGVWSQVDFPLVPWLFTVNLNRRVPVVYSADSTPRLLRQFGAYYGYWGGRSAFKERVRTVVHAACVRRATMIQAWSQWAADSLCLDYGVDPSRISVIPPGVDLEFWRPAEAAPIAAPHPEERPVRVLFVGGDFVRKGGDLLLDVYREQLRGRATLDLVTHGMETPESPGVRVHRGFRPNDPRLRDLYQQADIFVLPTRADCFSLAGIEAMASGLPVVICPVGGVAELLQSGQQGIFVPPDDGRALAQAIVSLVEEPSRRRVMGTEARRLAVRRYDAEKNTTRVLEQLLSRVPASATGGSRD